MPKHPFLLFSLFFALTWLSAQPVFQPAAGLYADPVTVRISGLPTNGPVYYTTNGDTPTEDSNLLTETEDFYFEKNTVLRILLLDEDDDPVYYGASYLIGEPDSRLPVISIAIDNDRLFDRKTGWFNPSKYADKVEAEKRTANFWSNEEHPGHLDLLEADGRSMFSGLVGYRLFGGHSRLHPQKSLSVSCRKKYGQKKIKYPVFGKEELDEFKFLVFRNGGSDWSRTHMRDAVLSDLLVDESWDLDHQANRPALMYINGKYWGLYHIREKINRGFIADHRGYDKDSLDLLEHQETIKAGSKNEYVDLMAFLNTYRFDEERRYRELGEKMDIDNFMRHQIAQTYFDNRDAGGNIRYYRPHLPDGVGVQKWRWVLYDLDYSFGLYDSLAYAHNTLAMYANANGPTWPSPPWSTKMQRRLLTSPEYRRFFVNRTLDYLQTDFLPERVIAAIDEHAAEIEPEMPRALKRWKLKPKYWYYHVDRLRRFAELRPQYLRQHLREFFGAGDDREIHINSSAGGRIVLNDNIAITGDWRGAYFANYPLRLRAAPLPGYRFVGWSETDEVLPELDIDLTHDQSYFFTANFKPYHHQLEGEVVITEIGGRQQKSGAWIEIYNGSDERVNVRDWLLTNETGRQARLPQATIRPGDRLVVFADRSDFRGAYANVVDRVKCSALEEVLDGKSLGLFSQRGARIDAVKWRGGQRDIQALSSPNRDNSLPKNWLVLEDAGTPGSQNYVSAFSLGLQTGSLWWRVGFALVLIGVLWRAARVLR